MTPKQKAQEIYDELRGHNSHECFENCKIVVKTALEVIYSIIGEQKHMWTSSEYDTIRFWESVGLEIISMSQH